MHAGAATSGATDSNARAASRRRRKYVLRNLRALRFVLGERPVPLVWWRIARAAARRIEPGPDALLLSRRRYVRKGAAFDDAELQALLAPFALGEFALDAQSIDFLRRRGDADRPAAVLQCGAGVSTLALAHMAKRRRAAGARCVVVALEEGPYARDAVVARLAATGLSHDVHVVLAPLDSDGRYGFDPTEVARLAGAPFDWVVVEGPLARAGRRALSLLDAAPLCAEGASWFLDEAFRDAQLDVLDAWASTPSVEVRGILPLVGKGLAIGRLRPGRMSAPAR